MSFFAEITITPGDIDATVDPASGDYVGPANAIEVAAGPTPCVVDVECNGDGYRRRLSNVQPGRNWAGLTITKVYGSATGTTATSIRLRWGSSV